LVPAGTPRSPNRSIAGAAIVISYFPLPGIAPRALPRALRPVYGPNQRDHSFPVSSVFPLRTKNSSRGSPAFLSTLTVASPALAVGPHHSIRPHCEKEFSASKRLRAKRALPARTRAQRKTLPGFAVHRNTLSRRTKRESPVLRRTPISPVCAYTPRPSITSSEPVLPVPAASSSEIQPQRVDHVVPRTNNNNQGIASQRSSV